MGGALFGPVSFLFTMRIDFSQSGTLQVAWLQPQHTSEMLVLVLLLFNFLSSALSLPLYTSATTTKSRILASLRLNSLRNFLLISAAGWVIKARVITAAFS